MHFQNDLLTVRKEYVTQTLEIYKMQSLGLGKYTTSLLQI